jgi:superfamily II DNA or RNA helicase
MMDPDKGYRDQILWLPKSRVNYRAISGTLRKVCASVDGLLENGRIYEEREHHIGVPRNFPAPGTLPPDLKIVDRCDYRYQKKPFRCTAMPRDDIQRRSVGAIMDQWPQDGILSLACGKGKTIVSIMAAAQFQLPVFVVVPTGIVMGGWVAELIGDTKTNTTPKTTLTKKDIGIIQGDDIRWDGYPVTLCMLNTLAFRSDEWSEEMRRYPGLIIYDECHRLGATQFSRASTIFYGPRLGLTATLTRPDRMDFVFRYQLGEVIYRNVEQDLQPSYTFMRTPTRIPSFQKELVIDATGQVNTSLVNSWLSRQMHRNALIINEIKKMRKYGRNILILSHIRDHVEILRAMLGYGEVIHGGIKPESERRRRLFSSDVTFATLQLVKEGTNKPELDTLFLVTPSGGEEDPTRTSITFPQASGRICRIREGKKKPLVLVLEDHLISACSRQLLKMKQEIRNRGDSYDLDRQAFPPPKVVQEMVRKMEQELPDLSHR